VLVTGATRGIGLAIARALSREGARVVATARNQQSLNKAGDVSSLAVACDVRDPKAVQSLCALIKKRFHHLDILINNAGIAHPNLSADRLSVEQWRDVIDTNLTGMFSVTHYALPLMRPGGVVVNNLSIAAKRAFPGSSGYNASKHGGLGFTNTLREELRSRNIRVVALLPGATDTQIWNSLWPDAPRKKMLSPETVATAVVNALKLPQDSAVEELVIMPAAGTL
jgi:NAD(P)-dependent dehydrogenase (short-subunit alcohol dehydrogenase family)